MAFEYEIFIKKLLLSNKRKDRPNHLILIIFIPNERQELSEVIKEIHASDPRYDKGAYYFIREALDHILRN